MSVTWSIAWRMIRATCGWVCIAVGILGLILPVLPGLPILAVGVTLVGHRHHIIRRSMIYERRLLRRCAVSSSPLLSALGRGALIAQRRAALLMSERFTRHH